MSSAANSESPKSGQGQGTSARRPFWSTLVGMSVLMPFFQSVHASSAGGIHSISRVTDDQGEEAATIPPVDALPPLATEVFQLLRFF